MSPMYMQAIAQAVEQDKLTLRHSVQPRVLPTPASTTTSEADSCDNDAAAAQATIAQVKRTAKLLLLQQTPLAVGTGQAEQPTFRPIRVVFEPSASYSAAGANSDANKSSGGGDDDAAAKSQPDHGKQQMDQHNHGAAKNRRDTVAEFDKILLGTGVKADCRSVPFVRDLLENCEAVPIIGGFPVLSTDLQWGSLPVFVVGALAGLQLGPGALNLMGARHGADIVATKLGVNDDQETGKVGGVFTNVFSALAGESTVSLPSP